MTLIPAYGRDYKSKAAVLTDWHDDKDFIIVSMFHPADGKPTHKSTMAGYGRVEFRYGNQRKVFSMVI